MPTKQMHFSHTDRTGNGTNLRVNRFRTLPALFRDIFARFGRVGNRFPDRKNLHRYFAQTFADGWLSFELLFGARRESEQQQTESCWRKRVRDFPGGGILTLAVLDGGTRSLVLHSGDE